MTTFSSMITNLCAMIDAVAKPLPKAEKRAYLALTETIVKIANSDSSRPLTALQRKAMRETLLAQFDLLDEQLNAIRVKDHRFLNAGPHKEPLVEKPPSKSKKRKSKNSKRRF